MHGYSYAIEDRAVLFFAGLSSRRRAQLLRQFDQLAANPFVTGEFQEFGEGGRRYELTLAGNTLTTWWTDHAAQEVRIVRLERVD